MIIFHWLLIKLREPTLITSHQADSSLAALEVSDHDKAFGLNR